jgi:hypothetical protein
VNDPSLRRKLVLLFVVALAARLATLRFLDPNRDLAGDENGYVTYVWNLSRGAGFSLNSWNAPPSPPQGVSFRTPLLPALLTPLLWMNLGAAAYRVANMAIGAACAPLLFAALRRSPLGDRAFWPALALALWPPAIFLSAQVLAEPLAMALVLAAIAVRPDTGRGVLGSWQSLVAGVLGGLAVLARPASLIASAFVGIARGSARAAMWFAIGAALVVGPWVVRNWAIHGRPLLTTNTGVTLVGGNSAAALAAEWPGKWAPPEQVYAGRDDAPDLAPSLWGWAHLSEEASDRRFAADAWTWVREHPGDFVRLCGFKLLRLFDPDQHSARGDAGLKRIVGWATYFPVLLLAVAGGAIAWRDRRAWAPWWALVAGTVATTLVFYGDVRMRTPMDPALLAFAALAAFRALDRLRGGRPAGG